MWIPYNKREDINVYIVSCNQIPKVILTGVSCYTELKDISPAAIAIANTHQSSPFYPANTNILTKSATVVPLIKKLHLTKKISKNYRPVSNLPYISKLIERVAVQQLDDHMTSHSLH